MSSHRILVVAGALGFAIAALACTELGDDALFAERPEEPPPDVAPEVCPKPVPTEVADIFATACSGPSCHTDGGAKGGLALDAADAANNLVQVTAQNDPEKRLRVAPGDPDASYLILKVRGDAPPQMPLGKDPLSEDQIATLTDWVTSQPACEEAGDTGDDTDTDTGTDDTGTETTEDTGTGDDGGEPELPENIATIFTTHCSGGFCHTNGQTSGGLGLDADIAIANTVDVPSNGEPDGMPRVTPGDPANSYLYLKITAEGPGAGNPMPQGSTGLKDIDADAVTAIETWINDLADPGTGGDDAADATDAGETGDTTGDTTGDDTGDATGGDDSSEPLPEAVGEVFTTHCSGQYCHTNGQESGGMSLDPDVAVANTVNVKAATGPPDAIRVVPGDLDNSYLWLKVSAADGIDSPMPKDTGGLEGESPEALQTIKDWILNIGSGGGGGE